MNTRRFGCCPCCDDVALSDHVGHGGDIEKDGHEMPCELLHDTRPAGEANGRGTYWSELDYQRVRAERDTLRAELDALRGRVAALADRMTIELAGDIERRDEAGHDDHDYWNGVVGGSAWQAQALRNLLDGPA